MKPSAFRLRAAALSTLAVTAALLTIAPTVSAAIVPTVPLGTSGEYSVLGGQTVTNTGDSVLNLSLGVYPGAAITGFPPGLVVAPGTTHAGDAVALQAQSDLTVAYDNAALRPLDGTLPADLTGQNLQGGVYASSSKGPLLLSGNMILDGAGNPNTVFIFQTDSTLTTGAGSTVSLINGAQECNIFWQIGSSATIGAGSDFVGNILALTSIAVNANATIHGRALARNGEVTLIDDTFVAPLCDLTSPVPTTTAPGTGGAPVTNPDGSPVTNPDGSPVTNPNGSPVTAFPGDTLPTGDIPGSDLFLPRTGRSSSTTLLIAMATLAIGATAVRLARRKPASAG